MLWLLLPYLDAFKTSIVNLTILFPSELIQEEPMFPSNYVILYFLVD